jgi:hypothetical protein
MVTCFPGLYLTIQIHAIRTRECSLGLIIRDRHICCLDHTLHTTYVRQQEQQQQEEDVDEETDSNEEGDQSSPLPSCGANISLIWLSSAIGI